MPENMNGSFTADTGILFPSTVAPSETTNANEERQKRRKIRSEIRAKRNEAMREYLNVAKPRDYRFAQRVHGAALAPPWGDIWTDDTSLASNPRASAMDRDVRSAVSSALKTNIQAVMETASDGSKVDVSYVQEVQDSLQKLVPKDTAKSRLSNLVLEQEQQAICSIRRFVGNHLRRRSARKSVSELYNVNAMLDLSKYGNDAHVLARSLRRDDLAYSSFASLVGGMVLQSRHMDGRHGASILQTRMMNRRVGEALQQCVTFLGNMQRQLVVDTIGQPDVNQLYETGSGDPLILVTKEPKESKEPKRTMAAGSPSSSGDEEEEEKIEKTQTVLSSNPAVALSNQQLS